MISIDNNIEKGFHGIDKGFQLIEKNLQEIEKHILSIKTEVKEEIFSARSRLTRWMFGLIITTSFAIIAAILFQGA